MAVLWGAARIASQVKKHTTITATDTASRFVGEIASFSGGRRNAFFSASETSEAEQSAISGMESDAGSISCSYLYTTWGVEHTACKNSPCAFVNFWCRQSSSLGS